MNIDSKPHRRGLKAEPYEWRSEERPPQPGIGLFVSGHHLIRFLTPEQALDLSNQLVDAVEAHDNQRSSNASEA